MTAIRATLTSVITAALLTVQAAPALAQQQAPRRSPATTIVKWALIGAATGAGIGFVAGFKAYDDATFAERKIRNATLAGAGIGAATGIAIGAVRGRRVVESGVPSLWTLHGGATRRPVLRGAEATNARSLAALRDYRWVTPR